MEWIKHNFWIPELKGPIVVYPYQERCLREALSKDADGNYKYSVVVWSDIKKSMKSSLAAAVCNYFAFEKEYAEVYIIANDLKGADSRVAMYSRRSLELNPSLRKKYHTRGYRTLVSSNHSFIEAIPIDPSGEAGSNADAIIFSELWGAHEEAKQRMWSEMTLSPTKFGQSLRWIESYAGYIGQSELLYGLYETGVLKGRRLWDDPMPTMTGEEIPIEAYVNEDARMFCLWNTVPRLPWQTPQYYKSEAALLRDNEFQRIHRNQWVTPQESFIPAEWWDACRDGNIPPMRRLEPIVVAIDAGVSDDSFGMVAVSRHPTEADHTIVRYSRRWLPPKGGKINFEGTEENPGPELELLRLCKEWNVVQVAYDPSQLEDMAGRLRRRGIAWFKPFAQMADRAAADSNLRTRIRDRRIHHGGDPDLREHIVNADAKMESSGTERNMRLIKRSQSMKIDLAVTLSMADYQAMRLNL